MLVGPEILRLAGEALYGERWQSPLSRDLGVSDRTVRNWAAERHECPDDLPTKLLSLLRARGESVDRLTKMIELHVERARVADAGSKGGGSEQ